MSTNNVVRNFCHEGKILSTKEGKGRGVGDENILHDWDKRIKDGLSDTKCDDNECVSILYWMIIGLIIVGTPFLLVESFEQ